MQFEFSCLNRALMKFPIVPYIFIKMFHYNYSWVTVHYHFHVKLSNSFSIYHEYSREPSDNYTQFCSVPKNWMETFHLQRQNRVTSTTPSRRKYSKRHVEILSKHDSGETDITTLCLQQCWLAMSVGNVVFVDSCFHRGSRNSPSLPYPEINRNVIPVRESCAMAVLPMTKIRTSAYAVGCRVPNWPQTSCWYAYV